jgi:hypothetical protein
LSAVLFYLPFPVAFTSNGVAAPLARAYFYQTGTTTPLPIYTTSALSVEHSNPVIADGVGRFANIYLDSTKTYRLVIHDKDDASLGVDIDPYIPGTAPDAGSLQPYADAASGSASSASTSAANAATSATSAASSASAAAGSATSAASSATSAASSQAAIIAAVGGATLTNVSLNASSRTLLASVSHASLLPAILTESGYSGIFQPTNSNIATSVTNDSYNNIGYSTDSTGAGGGFQRLPMYRSVLDRKWVSSLPVGSISLPAAFNNQLSVQPYWDGSRVQFQRNPYDIIDFTTTASTITDYYIDYDVGNDANAGTSSGAAFKTWDHALSVVAGLSAGSNVKIHLLDDYVGYLSATTGNYPQFDGKNVKVIGAGPSGRTKFVLIRETYDQASFAWVAHGSNGAWKSNSASVGQYVLQFYLDGGLIPQPIVSTGQSAATVDTTELTSFWDGTYLYVHLPNGVKPNPRVNWEWSNNAVAGHTYRADTGTVLFENCGWFTSARGANFNCFSTRSVTDSDFTSDARIGFRNCFGYGASGNIFGTKDWKVVVFDNCQGAWAKNDIFNYHTNQSTGTHGAFITAYEVNCSGRKAGYTGFADGAGTSTSNNGSTSHDSINILRANCNYGDAEGAVVADVNGVVSVNLNVQAGCPGSTANPKACFWHSGTGYGTYYGMYLWGCAATDDEDSSTYLLTSDGAPNGEASGQIYVKHWRGATVGTIKGRLKDWAGNLI